MGRRGNRGHDRAAASIEFPLLDANGIDLTAQIRAMPPGTEVIVVSQHDSSACVGRARAAGAFGRVANGDLGVRA